MERRSKPGGPGVRDRDEAETTKPNESTTTHQPRAQAQSVRAFSSFLDAHKFD